MSVVLTSIIHDDSDIRRVNRANTILDTAYSVLTICKISGDSFDISGYVIGLQDTHNIEQHRDY